MLPWRTWCAKTFQKELNASWGCTVGTRQTGAWTDTGELCKKSVVIFKTHLDEPLSCTAWVHSWTCFEGCLKLPSIPGHITTFLLIHFIHSSCYDVFKENLCVATMESVVSVEEQHWFTQCIGWDGELFGMQHQGVSETCSVQRLGFQKNATVLGCLFLVWGWTKQPTPVSESWQKAVVELSHFQTKGTDSKFFSAHMNSGCLIFFFFCSRILQTNKQTHPPKKKLKGENSCIKRVD